MWFTCVWGVTYWVDVGVQPFLNANVVWPIARPFPVTVDVDRVHVVTFSTICALDFQRRVNTHCMPIRSNDTVSQVPNVVCDVTAWEMRRKRVNGRKLKHDKIDGRQKYRKIYIKFIIIIRKPSDIFVFLVVLHSLSLSCIFHKSKTSSE